MTLFVSTTDITISYNLTDTVLGLNLGLAGMLNVEGIRLVDAQLLKETADNFTMRISMFNNQSAGPTELFMDFTLRTVPNIPLGGSQEIINPNRFVTPFCFNVPINSQDTQTKYFVAEVFAQLP